MQHYSLSVWFGEHCLVLPQKDLVVLLWCKPILKPGECIEHDEPLCFTRTKDRLLFPRSPESHREELWINVLKKQPEIALCWKAPLPGWIPLNDHIMLVTLALFMYYELAVTVFPKKNVKRINKNLSICHFLPKEMRSECPHGRLRCAITKHIFSRKAITRCEKQFLLPPHAPNVQFMLARCQRLGLHVCMHCPCLGFSRWNHGMEVISHPIPLWTVIRCRQCAMDP